VPDIPGMFASFNVKSKDSTKTHPLFVDPRLFEDTQHYIKIMGYDKPIDFQMDLVEKEENTEKSKK
jgi:transmembrane protein 70